MIIKCVNILKKSMENFRDRWEERSLQGRGMWSCPRHVRTPQTQLTCRHWGRVCRSLLTSPTPNPTWCA